MTIAFLHAHPDDEAIFTGGTLARLAAAGYRTVVVVATSGELGRDDGGNGPLASRRRAETRAACVELGVAALHFLPFHDSGLGADAVETHLVEHAHRSLPQLGTLGSPTVEIDTTVDVRSVLDAKRRAIDAHVSQVPGDPAAWIPGAGFADVYGYEWYLRLGPPGTLDSLVRKDRVPSSEPALPLGGRPLS